MFETRKALRTAQSYAPFLLPLKNAAYHYGRKYLRIAHEADFAAIASLPTEAADLFLDIGGNRGQSILSIRRYRPSARIMSFEPNPRIFKELAQKFGAMPGIELVNFGLGTKEETRTLFEPSYRGFLYDGIASFSRQSTSGYFCSDNFYFFDPKQMEIVERPCLLRPLDALGLAPSFVKIDVEGFELQVLLGAEQTLRQHQPVLLIERFYESKEMFAFLQALGYSEALTIRGRFEWGRSQRINAIMMTQGRFDAIRRKAAQHVV